MTTDPSTDSTTRVSDEDRERVAQALQEHVAAGRLDLAEYDSRVAAAYAAVTRADFTPILADLPVTTSAVTPTRRSASDTWSDASERYTRVQDSVRGRVSVGCAGRRDAAAAWGSWALTGVICVAIWLVVAITSQDVAGFWPIWVIGPWGLVLLAGTLAERTGLTTRRT